MSIPMASSKQKVVYGLNWPTHMEDLSIEMSMIKAGGTVALKDGKSVAGNGLAWHWRRALSLLDPALVWHKWNTLQSECYNKYRTIAVLGPASSGKTRTAAGDVLLDYYLYPTHTSIIICSTTRERLEDRIWGELKKLHRVAKELYPWLPGHLIEGRMRLVTDARSEAEEGRDFRNGIIGVPCKRGDSYIGVADFAGIKNKRVRLLGDEISFLPRAFVDAISNLDKNEDFKAIGLGNPKDTTDALGILAEPSTELGGWDSGIDQSPKTKTWPIRRKDGICVQLVGSDSPNLDGRLGIPLITQEQIDRDVAFYGRDSMQFTMMNEGRMPRGQGAHRVLTRQMCEKFGAMTEPLWRDTRIKKIAWMDAGYGGDRCTFGEIQFGLRAEHSIVSVATTPLFSQEPVISDRKQLLHLVDHQVVPVSADKGAPLPEDQIVTFVVAELARRGIPLEDFFYDPGMRTKLTVAFARITGQTGSPIDCGGKATERPVAEGIDVKCVDYYSKFVTELWYSVRLAVEAGQVRGMTEDLVSEFAMREWKKVAGNRIEVEPKEDMKKKMGHSPDLADGFAIGMEGARQRGFIIVKIGSEVKRKNPQNDSWKRKAEEKANKIWHDGDLEYA